MASSDGESMRVPRPELPHEWTRLERAVRRMLDHYEHWQRRAIESDARIRDLEGAVTGLSTGGLDPLELERRIQSLESENAELRSRLTEAHERVRRIVARLRFMEEAR